MVILSVYVLAALVGRRDRARRADRGRVAAGLLGALDPRWLTACTRARPQALAGLDALAAITDAVEAGAGLPEILRAAARALDASLILIDRSATVLAVAARSPADERSLMRDADDVTTIELKVAEAPVGSCGCGRASGRPTPRCCGW